MPGRLKLVGHLLLVAVFLPRGGSFFTGVRLRLTQSYLPKLVQFCPQEGMSTKVRPSAVPASYMVDGSEITTKTLGHYSRRAEMFWEGTKDHDVTQNRAALLRNMDSSKSPANLHILDLGCGPGRDVQVFSDLGYRVTGLDGCPEFVEMAQALCPGASFLLQDLHQLDLPAGEFDGIFANAVLFHVKRSELAGVLRKLVNALRPDGVLFVSNPRSMQTQDMENFGMPEQDERYGHYQTLESWTATVETAGLTLVEHYYRPPGAPRHQQPWLATVSRHAS